MCAENVRTTLPPSICTVSHLSLYQYDLVTTNIRQITHDGIETEDGKRIDLDVIICATGELTRPYLLT